MIFNGLEQTAIRQLRAFIIIYMILGTFANVTFRTVNKTTADKTIMRTDSEGYYQYLPHFFILDWAQMDKMHWTVKYENGKNLNVYTCGVAIMQSPFFLAAHAISYFFELERTGYTSVYFLSLFYASLFYVLLGLLFLYKFLRRFFNHKAAFSSIILIFFATNLFYYTIIAPGMSHAYSFSLVAFFIFAVPVFYENPTFKNILLVAFPLALATLIRPTNLLVVFFLFLYDTYDVGALRTRIRFWLTRWYFLFILLVVGVVVVSPQMLYWHFITGKYIFYSYQDGGTFPYWLSPKIFTVLFGPRNGWYLYTPLMIFATIGLIYLAKKKQLSSWAIALILVAIIYINSSWWRPTFSGAAGYRALIEYLPFMAIPLSYFSDKIFNKRKLFVRLYWGVLVFFVIYNVLFAYKYSPWHWWNTEWQWSYFLKLVKF